jgi:hypothetical protein
MLTGEVERASETERKASSSMGLPEGWNKRIKGTTEDTRREEWRR